MAEKKTTSTSGFIGQPLGSDLNFDQFSSGPRLFTPVPVPQNSTTTGLNISTPPVLGLPAPRSRPAGPLSGPPPSLNRTFPSYNVRPPFSSGHTPIQPFNTPPPARLPTYVHGNVSATRQPVGQLPVPPLQYPKPIGELTTQLPSTSPPIPMFQPHPVHLGSPMIPTTLPTTTTTTNTNRLMQMGSPQPVQPLVGTSVDLKYSSSDKTTPVTSNKVIHHQQKTTLSSREALPAMETPPPITSSSMGNPRQPYGSMQHSNLNTSQEDTSQNFNISPFTDTQTSSGRNDEISMQSAVKVVPHWFFLKTSVQWLPFYKSSTQWTPFSIIDSRNLEHEFLKMKMKQSGVVRTRGGRYDVDLTSMEMQSVYWNEAPSEVRRCTWFLKEENQFVPYEVAVADKLEEAYLAMMSQGVFNVRVDVAPGTFVIFHNPNVLVQYNPNQDMEWTGEDSKAHPKVVRRDMSVEMRAEIEQGEEEAVEHLVFVVHGIGPVADLRMRSIVECVDDLRRNSLNFTNTHGYIVNGRAANRVEYLPIQWYGSLHDDKSGVDRQLNSLSLPSISKLRNFTNEVLTDILFFTSPMYCQTICDTVVNEMNRLYKLFKTRNPTYNGTTSIVGHSLGTCISFDILANQKDDLSSSSSSSLSEETYEDFGEQVEMTSSKTSSSNLNISLMNTSYSSSTVSSEASSMHDILTQLNLNHLEKQFTDEQIDVDSLMVCQDSDLRDLGIAFGPRKKLLAYIKGKSSNQSSLKSAEGNSPSHTLQSLSPDAIGLSTRGTQTRVQLSSSGQVIEKVDCSFKKADGVGTGQPMVTYKKLDFETDCLFCLGSPIGLFLTCRGVSNIGPEYKLPKCDNFLNIFHPYDPVVYRLEPLINKDIDIPPVLIPHHKGRKRFHLEIKDNLTRVGANLKSGIMNAFNMTWSSINDFARSHQTDYQAPADDGKQQEKVEEPTITEQEALELKRKEESLNFGQLNNGKRVDYVLQERPFEVLNEYLFALGSHTCYWTSEDTALLILKQIYNVQD